MSSIRRVGFALVGIAVALAGLFAAALPPSAAQDEGTVQLDDLLVSPLGDTEVTPSVLVMPRSACGVRVSVSVALLLPATGSVAAPVTVAVLDKVPVAAGLMVQEAV